MTPAISEFPRTVPYRVLGHGAPLHWPSLLAFFAARAIPAVERVEGDRYLRTFALDGVQGTLEVAPLEDGSAVTVALQADAARVLPQIEARVQRQFDLDRDPATAHAQLARDPLLAPLVAERPGLRVPGAWDPFELAVRAVLGQQVSVVAARALAARLSAAYGEPLARAAQPGLERVFPEPERVRDVDSLLLGMPRARAATLRALAGAAAEDPQLLVASADLAADVARLRALPGIGEWTAQYIALRALRHPDAFPATDAGLLRAYAAAGAAEATPAALLAHAERWRPYRGYAAQQLWSSAG